MVSAGTALLGGVLLVTVLDPRSATAQTVGDLGILASAVPVLVGDTRAARRGGPSARGWVGVAVAVLVWFLAMSVYAAYGLHNGHVYPFPSVADLGFVG